MDTQNKAKFDFSVDTPVVEEHLDDLVGLGPATLDALPTRDLENGPGPLRVADLLRKRNDGTIALKGCVESPCDSGIHCFTARLML